MIMTRHSMARVSSSSFDEDYCGAVPAMVAFNWESAPGKPLKPLPKSGSISKRTSTSSSSSLDKSPLPLPPGRRILQQSHLQSFSGPLISNSSLDAAPTKPSIQQTWGHKLFRNHAPQGIRSQSYGSDGELDIAVQKKIGSERPVSTRFNPAMVEVNCASGRRNASATLNDLVELAPVILPPVDKVHAMDDLLQLELAKDEEDEPLPLPPGRRPKDGFYLQYPRPVESEAHEGSGKPRDQRKLHTPKKLKRLLGWHSKQQLISAGRVRRDARDAGDISGEEESIEYLDGTNSQENEAAHRLKARLSKKIAALRSKRPHIRKCFHFEGSSTPAVRSPRVHHSHFSGPAEEKLSRGGCRPHSSSRRKSHRRSLTLSSVKNPCRSDADEEKSDLSELHTSATVVNESTSASSGHDTSRRSSSPGNNSSRGLGCTSSGAEKLHHHVADPYACCNFPAEVDHHQQPGKKHQPSCKFMANMLISLCPSDDNEEVVHETLDASNSSSQLKEIASSNYLSARRNYSGSSSTLNPILLSNNTEESSSSPTLLKLPQQQAQEAELFPHQQTTSKVNLFCNSSNSKESVRIWSSSETKHQNGNFIPAVVSARGSSTTKELLHQDSEAMSDPSSKVQQLTESYSFSEKSLTSPTIRSNHGHSKLSRRSMMRSSSKLEQQTLPTRFNEDSAQTSQVDNIKPKAGDPGDPGDVQAEPRKFSKSVRTSSPRISSAGSNTSSPRNSPRALGGELDLISPNSSSRRSSSRFYSQNLQSPSKLRSLISESCTNSLTSQEDSLNVENHQQPIYSPERIKDPVVLPPAVDVEDQNSDNCRPQAGASSWMGQVLKAPSMWFKSPIVRSNLRDEKPSDQSYSTSEELDAIPGRGSLESVAPDVNNNLFDSMISSPPKLLTSWVVSQETMKSSPLVKFKLQHEQMYESPRSSFAVDDTRIVATLKDDVTQILVSSRNNSQVRGHLQDQMTENAAPHRLIFRGGDVNIHAKHPNTPDVFATATTPATSLNLVAAPPKSVMSLVAQWESKMKVIGSPASTKSARPLTWKSR